MANSNDEGSYLADSDEYSEKSTYSIGALASHKRGKLDLSSAEESAEGNSFDTVGDQSPIPSLTRKDVEAWAASASVPPKPKHESRSKTRDRKQSVSKSRETTPIRKPRSRSRSITNSEKNRNITDLEIQDMDLTNLPEKSKETTGLRSMSDKGLMLDMTKPKPVPRPTVSMAAMAEPPDSPIMDEWLSLNSNGATKLSRTLSNPNPNTDSLTDRIIHLTTKLDRKEEEIQIYNENLDNMKGKHTVYKRRIYDMQKENEACHKRNSRTTEKM